MSKYTDENRFRIPDFTIKIVTHEEYMETLRFDLQDKGLCKAVEERLDNINDECSIMSYASHSYVQEMLSEILELVKMSEAKYEDDMK